LDRFGYQQRGNEVMYNGHTGQRLDAQIFIGSYSLVCTPPAECLTAQALPSTSG